MADHAPLQRQLGYAVRFKESPGYLLVNLLGAGADGDVFLIRTLDGRLFARKAMHQAERSSDIAQAAEVRSHKVHVSIPKLITFAGYPSVDDPTKLNVAVVFQFCNGPNLAKLLDMTCQLNGEAPRLMKKIPEPFLWHLFYTLLDVLLYISSTASNYMAHGDVSESNTFLDWPSDPRSLFPRVLIGDYTRASHFPGTSANDSPWRQNPLSHISDPNTLRIALNWYNEVSRDHIHAAQLVREMLYPLLPTEMLSGLTTLDKSLRRAARQGTPCFGYSTELVRAVMRYTDLSARQIWVSSNLTDQRPSGLTGHQEYMQNMRQLHLDVTAQYHISQSSYTQYAHDDHDLRDLIPPASGASTQPALWPNLNELRRGFPADTSQAISPEPPKDTGVGTGTANDEVVDPPTSLVDQDTVDYYNMVTRDNCDITVLNRAKRIWFELTSAQCDIVQVRQTDDGEYEVLQVLPWAAPVSTSTTSGT